MATLPVVVGVSGLIYYYLRYSALVERKLSGDRWLMPARIYSRPLELRPGEVMPQAELVRLLNGLRYGARSDGVPGAGQFLVRENEVVLFPRTGIVREPVRITFGEREIELIESVETREPFELLVLEKALISRLFDESREKRRFVTYDELPEHLIQAVLAIEDRRFFSHPGLDPIRIVAAAIRNVQAESYIQGGSTITQQLVKNFFLTPERTIKRKAQEALIAVALERRADKREILAMYLNEIYFGQSGSFSVNGVGEAARMLFGKDVTNLALPESALIAGMIASPNPYNPHRHPERALSRRNLVIRSMVEAEYLTEAEGNKAMSEQRRIEMTDQDTTDAPYFVDLLKTQLLERYAKEHLIKSNLEVHSSLDLHLQDVAQIAVAEGLAEVEAKIEARQKRYRRKVDVSKVQAALIAMDVQSGAVLALVGGRSYGESQYNRAVKALRQPGSTFKPFVYLTAFEATFEDLSLPPITPATIIEDEPAVFFYEDKEYIPQNYTRAYLGPVTVRRALTKSLNIPTVKVAEMVGFDRIANVWGDRLGIGDNVMPYPAVALGAFEATPLEMATAYNVLANGGRKVEPLTVQRVLDTNGVVLEQNFMREAPQVVRPEAAYLVVSMMRGVINEGTGAGVRARGFLDDAAGKTGTTNDTKDAWFAGFTPQLLCVVWVGFDDNSPLRLDGASAALPIWTRFMIAASKGQEAEHFSVPEENIVFVEIDKETGRLATPFCPRTVQEAFIAGTEPREMCWH